MRRGSSTCSASGSVLGPELFSLVTDNFSVGIEVVDEKVNRACKAGKDYRYTVDNNLNKCLASGKKKISKHKCKNNSE